MIKNIILTICILCAIAVSAVSSFGEVVDKIVVVVNDEVITQGEIDRMLEPVYQQYRAVYSGDELIEKLEEASRKVVDQLIEDRLMLSEAKKQNIEVDDKDIEARIDDIKKRVGSQEQFERALAEQDLTVKGLRTRYKEQMMTRKLIDQKVGSRVKVTPVEINDYYSKHIDEFVQPEELKVSNILIRPKSEQDSQKALDSAKEILRRLREGGDFAGLAKEYSEGPYASDGGGMGYVKKGDLLPEIETVIFSMKEGEVSEVVQTSLGYHIFKVEEKRARKVRELSEVRREVEEAVFRDKIKSKLKGWIEGLRKNAYIAFK